MEEKIKELHKVRESLKALVQKDHKMHREMQEQTECIMMLNRFAGFIDHELELQRQVAAARGSSSSSVAVVPVAASSSSSRKLELPHGPTLARQLPPQSPLVTATSQSHESLCFPTN